MICSSVSTPTAPATIVYSETIVSPDRSHRAYAVTEAVRSRHRECVNTSQLYVAVDGHAYERMYTQRPSDLEGTANSLAPVAWSRDNRWLAVESLSTYHRATDYASRGLLLYDAREKRVHLINSDFSVPVGRFLGKKCSITVQAVQGFDDAGRLFVRIADSYSEEGHWISTGLLWLGGSRLSRPAVTGDRHAGDAKGRAFT